MMCDDCLREAEFIVHDPFPIYLCKRHLRRRKGSGAAHLVNSVRSPLPLQNMKPLECCCCGKVEDVTYLVCHECVEAFPYHYHPEKGKR